MPKIVLIGAGSVVFAKTLITDMLTFAALQSSTISLVDIDPDRLQLITAYARRVIEQQRLPATVEMTTDRREALPGADFVITVIQVGGSRAYELDMLIPARYGVNQAVGDTIGPGGVMRGLRSIPILLGIAHDMEELCPKAWLLNYTNPLAMNVWALYRGSKIKVVGLCHSVQGTAAYLARIVGVRFDKLRYWAAGINHLAWYLKLQCDGHDLYPVLRRRMRDPSIESADRPRFAMLRQTRHFVSESSYHLSEYVPYFRRTPEQIAAFLPQPRDYLAMYENGLNEQRQAIEAQLAGARPINLRRSREYASYIVDSIAANVPRRFNLNTRNDGLITNLPPGCCVEVPCLVDGAGIHPCYVGDLPEQCAALDRWSINVQALGVEAALTGSARSARQAMAVDPLTASLLTPRESRAMADELLDAEAEWLPELRRTPLKQAV
jgi:alpha-galactosidase